jgi:hypothetical protein
VRAYLDAVCDEIPAEAAKRVANIDRHPSLLKPRAEAAPHPPPSGAPSPTRGEG